MARRSLRRRALAATLAAIAVLGAACTPPPAAPSDQPPPAIMSMTPARTFWTLHWTSAGTPTEYRIEYRPLSGIGALEWVAMSGSYEAQKGRLDFAARTLLFPTPGQATARDFEFRISATYADGRTTVPSQSFTVTFPSRTTRLSLGAEQVAADHATLAGAGLDRFPSQPVSVLPTAVPGQFDWYGTQSAAPGGFAHTRGPLSAPTADEVVSTRTQIVGVTGGPEYTGAGPVWRDAGPGGAGGSTGNRLMLYTRRSHDDRGAWASLGAAWSADGVTFHELGEVVTPGVSRATRPITATGTTGPEAASLVVRDGWAYVYYNDALPSGAAVVAMARTPVAQLAAAAAGGAAPVFTKWYQGSFSTAGLGGLVSPIGAAGANPSVVRDACYGGYLMFTTLYAALLGPARSYLLVTSSDDGVHWPDGSDGFAQVPSGYRPWATVLGDQVGADGQVAATPGQLSVVQLHASSPASWWDTADLRVTPVLDADAGSCPT